MLFAGDDWAQDHHDVEIVDDQGRRLVRRWLPEGVEGIAGLHALIAASAPGEWADLDPAGAASHVKVGIETDRGPWVQALIAAGYEVFTITRCQLPGTGNGTPRRVRSLMPGMRMS
jgi:Transposase